jgi:hypothetical protein
VAVAYPTAYLLEKGFGIQSGEVKVVALFSWNHLLSPDSSGMVASMPDVNFSG